MNDLPPDNPSLSDHPETKAAAKDSTLRDRLAMDRTVLANERTLLAYLRTVIALIAAGISLLKFFGDDPWSKELGLFALGLGIAVLILGLFRFQKYARRYRVRH
jgi:putative membrane protein